MAYFGKFRYYSTTAPATDAGFGYPIMIAPPDKAVKITGLAVYDDTNTAGAEITLTIIPSTPSVLADGSYAILDFVNFGVGKISAALTGSDAVSPLNYAGIVTKGDFSEIIVPPSGMLVGYPSPTANLNGTIQYRAMGYECAVDAT